MVTARRQDCSILEMFYSKWSNYNRIPCLFNDMIENWDILPELNVKSNVNTSYIK